MIGNPAIKSWQKNVEDMRIVIPKSGWRRTKANKKKKKVKVITRKYLLPLIDCAIPHDDSIMKKGLITSEGWKEKLNIFNHLLDPLIWLSEKKRKIRSKIKIINPNNANLLTFLSFCWDKKTIIAKLNKKIYYVYLWIKNSDSLKMIIKHPNNPI